MGTDSRRLLNPVLPEEASKVDGRSLLPHGREWGLFMGLWGSNHDKGLDSCNYCLWLLIAQNISCMVAFCMKTVHGVGRCEGHHSQKKVSLFSD